jgi:hypothetical protein
MHRTIQQLHEVSHRINAGTPLDDDQRNWLGRALDDFLARRCRSIEEAMGLRFPRGGIPWWREEANRERDAALRGLASNHLAGMAIAAQARAIRMLTIRYAASTWRFDRTLKTMPPRYVGGLHEWLYRAFAARAPLPIGERSLRRILGR